jgi:phosphomannomutase
MNHLANISTTVIDMFDYCFAENGLTAYRQGVALPSNNFVRWLGEEKYKVMANFILHHIADLDIPVKRGTFIEFRNGMINVSPIGRNASVRERNEFEAYDKIHGVRKELVEKLKVKFAGYGLTYSIGGQISFDVFPQGWDKTYCLRHVEKEFETIHFFGDKTYQGGLLFGLNEGCSVTDTRRRKRLRDLRGLEDHRPHGHEARRHDRGAEKAV